MVAYHQASLQQHKGPVKDSEGCLKRVKRDCEDEVDASLFGSVQASEEVSRCQKRVRRGCEEVCKGSRWARVRRLC